MTEEERQLLVRIAECRQILADDEIRMANRLVGFGLVVLQPVALGRCDCCITELGLEMLARRRASGCSSSGGS